MCNHIGQECVTCKQRKRDMYIPNSFKKLCSLKSTVYTNFSLQVLLVAKRQKSVAYERREKHNLISETFTSHLKKLKLLLFFGIFSEVKNT